MVRKKSPKSARTMGDCFRKPRKSEIRKLSEQKKEDEKLLDQIIRVAEKMLKPGGFTLTEAVYLIIVVLYSARSNLPEPASATNRSQEP